MRHKTLNAVREPAGVKALLEVTLSRRIGIWRARNPAIVSMEDWGLCYFLENRAAFQL